MDDKQYLKSHKFSMLNRGNMVITGIKKVVSFKPEEVVLNTEMGAMFINGKELKVNRLSIEKGEVDIDGFVDHIRYSKSIEGKKTGAFVKRMFR